MGWFTRRGDRDVERELQAHLDLEAEEQRAAGCDEIEARASAMRLFGNRALVKEEVAAVWRSPSLDSLAQDVRFGVRMLVRGPVFTLFAVSSLALGLGAAGAIFSLVDAIVWRGLQVPEPSRLVLASIHGPGGRFNYSMPYPQFAAMRERSRTLEGLLAATPIGQVSVSVAGEPALADGLYVSGNYHRTLGVTPAAGRLLEVGDDRPGSAVAVISHGYWQRRFGGQPRAVGAAVRVNDVPFTIVGVEPPGFAGAELGRPPDISIPIRAENLLNEGRESRLFAMTDATWIYVLGRLRPGVTIERAQQELEVINRQAGIDGAHSPAARRLAEEWALRLEPGARGFVSGLRAAYSSGLQLLLALLAALLLLASLNLAALLLSRSAARQREIATRLTLGAGRWRIVRQLLTESLLLGGLAAVASLAVSAWGSGLLLRIATPSAERPLVDLALDLRLVIFTAVTAMAACLVFGALPALRVSGARRLAVLRQVGPGRRQRLADRSLVAAQVAISLILLVAAGLFLRSLERLWSQDTGYDRRNVLVFSTNARLAGRTGEQVRLTYLRLLDELRSVPGARSVTASAVRPVSETYYFIDVVSGIGGRDRSAPDRRVRVATNDVAPGYFATLGIPIVAGRDFDGRDRRGGAPVAIISEQMARHFTGSPIGQTISLGDDTREVVGVVKDHRYARVRDAYREVVFTPLLQAARIGYTPSYEIRYAAPLDAVLHGVGEAVARTDAGLTLTSVGTLDALTARSFSRERLLASVTGYIGVFAVLLACIGLYGLTSFGVTQRKPEMGIRLALGARPSMVRRMIVREGATTAVAGLLVGLPGAMLAARVLRTQLFETRPGDPTTLVTATALLLAVAAAAAYLPALRASRVDPAAALRHE
jgi:predicted permease